MKKQRLKTVGIFLLVIMIILSIIVFTCFCFVLDGTWGLNKTVGWQWDVSNLEWWFGVFLEGVLLFTFVFFIVFFMRRIRR